MSSHAIFASHFNGSNGRFSTQFNIAEGVPDDHDSAIGNIGTITGAETTRPLIPIDPSDPGEVSGWLMFSTIARGLKGKRPTISTPTTDTRYLDVVPDPVHRADSNTWVSGRPPAWLEFDNTVGTNPILSSMDTDFSGDMEFAMKPRWKYADTVSAVAYATASPYAQTLPSVTANAGAANSFNAITITSTVPNSAPLTTLQQHAFCLDDTANQPDGGEDKLNFVILARQHSSEDQGSYAAWEFIKYYLDGVGTDADWFRKHIRVYFYDPNPAGVYYGAERWSVSDAGGEDTNRQWAVGDTSSPVVVATKAAIQLDVADVDGFLDLHGFFSLYPGSLAISADWAGFDTIGGPSNANEIAFRARVNAAAAHTLTYGNGPEGENNLLAQHWGKNTLGAQLSQTIELGPEMPGYPDPNSMYGGIVQTMVQAFAAMEANGELVLRSTTFEAEVDYGLSLSQSVDNNADMESQVALSVQMGMTAASLLIVEAAISEGVFIGFSTSSEVSASSEIEAAVAFGLSLNGQAIADATALAEITSGALLGDNAVGDVTAAGEIDSFITVSSELSTQAIADAEAEANLNIGIELATALIAEAAVQAGLTVGSIQNVVFIGSSVSGDIVTPDRRTFSVSAEIRTYQVPLNARAHTVH